MCKIMFSIVIWWFTLDISPLVRISVPWALLRPWYARLMVVASPKGTANQTRPPARNPTTA